MAYNSSMSLYINSTRYKQTVQRRLFRQLQRARRPTCEHLRWDKRGEKKLACHDCGKTKNVLPLKTPLERLMALVEIQDNGCWRWIGCVGSGGYGAFSFQFPGKKQTHCIASRASYFLHKGPIPEDRPFLDHTCHDPKTCPGGRTCPHRRCVNPDHLKPCTKTENSSKNRACYVDRSMCKHCKERKRNRVVPEEYNERYLM